MSADYERWRRARETYVTGPNGSLALVETRWLGSTEPDLAAAQRTAPPSVTVTALQRNNALTGEPEYGLRFWDAEAPAISAFRGIETYPEDPSWVIEGTFTPVAGGRTVTFEHIRDNGVTRDVIIPGDITFSRDGAEYRVAALDDGGKPLLVFGDPTNGVDTYAPGRFLFVTRKDGAADPGTAGPVILDFNRAFVPPCGFSAQYNCPMPPAQNRFPWPVTAGEKRVIFADGFHPAAA